MPSRELRLLDEIESAAIDSSVSISDALRRAIALGGAVNSTPLREWASRELTGYEGVSEGDVPSYRKPPALIQMDSISGYTTANHQTIAPSSLPDFVTDQIKERITLYFPIAEIEEMATKDDVIRLTLPMAADLARYLHREWQLNEFQQITAIYWSVSPMSMKGVVDRVRTSLAELVAEIRAGLPAKDDSPSAELTNRALNIAIHGGSPALVINQGSGQNVVTVGDNNVVNVRFAPLIDDLDALKQELDNSTLAEELKHDAMADIESIKSQLRKNNPDVSTTRNLWSAVDKSAKLAGLASTAMSIGKALGELL